jgi:hypothetical protein
MTDTDPTQTPEPDEVPDDAEGGDKPWAEERFEQSYPNASDPQPADEPDPGEGGDTPA